MDFIRDISFKTIGYVVLILVGLIVLYRLLIKWNLYQKTQPIFFSKKSFYGNFPKYTLIVEQSEKLNSV